MNSPDCRPARRAASSLPVFALALAGLFGLLGGATEAPPEKNLGRTGREIEALTERREAAFLNFGKNDPSAWEQARRELRSLGEPLVSKDTMELLVKSESPNASDALEARMALFRRIRIRQAIRVLVFHAFGPVFKKGCGYFSTAP